MRCRTRSAGAHTARHHWVGGAGPAGWCTRKQLSVVGRAHSRRVSSASAACGSTDQLSPPAPLHPLQHDCGQAQGGAAVIGAWAAGLPNRRASQHPSPPRPAAAHNTRPVFLAVYPSPPALPPLSFSLESTGAGGSLLREARNYDRSGQSAVQRGRTWVQGTRSKPELERAGGTGLVVTS